MTTKTLHLSARDCLSTLTIEADMDTLHIEYRAGEGMGGGRWEYVEGELGMDRIFELHALLSEMIEAYKERYEKQEKKSKL